MWGETGSVCLCGGRQVLSVWGRLGLSVCLFAWREAGPLLDCQDGICSLPGPRSPHDFPEQTAPVLLSGEALNSSHSREMFLQTEPSQAGCSHGVTLRGSPSHVVWALQVRSLWHLILVSLPALALKPWLQVKVSTVPTSNTLSSA